MGAYDSPIPNYSISTGGSTGSHKPPTLPLDSSPHKLHTLQGSHEPWVSTHRGGNATGSVLDQREGGRVALRVAFSTQPGPAGHRGITGWRSGSLGPRLSTKQHSVASLEGTQGLASPARHGQVSTHTKDHQGAETLPTPAVEARQGDGRRGRSLTSPDPRALSAQTGASPCPRRGGEGGPGSHRTRAGKGQHSRPGRAAH